MADERELKVAKAKLYNLKSGIEGIIQMMETEVIEPGTAMASAITLAEKAAADFANQVSSEA